MPNAVEVEALALFILFVRENTHLAANDPVHERVLDAYRRSTRAKHRADEIARDSIREALVPEAERISDGAVDQ